MNALLDFIQSDASLWLCNTLMHSLWQFALLATVTALALKLRPDVTSETAYRAHVAALALGVFCFVGTFAWQMQSSNSQKTKRATASVATMNSPSFDTSFQATDVAVIETSATLQSLPAELPADRNGGTAKSSSTTATAKTRPFAALPFWIAIAYLLGVVVMLIRLMLSYRQVHKLRSKATILKSGHCFEALQSLTQKWASRIKPIVAVSADILVPQVVGLTRATILLPTSVVSDLSMGELNMVLTHELAHIRRYDLWIQLAQRLSETVLFFNPALWYLSRRISALREYCCDDATCSASSGTKTDQVQTQYAMTLLRVAADGLNHRADREKIGIKLAAIAADGHSPSELRRRVARLLGQPMREPFQIPRRSLLCVAGALSIWMCSLVWSKPAQPPAPDKQTETTVEDSDKTKDNADQPWKIRIPVSGQILLPDGSPAANVVVMTASDRYGWGEGFTNGNYTKTDKDGRFKIQSKRFFPQRLFWLPEGYENNSRAVSEGGGEQKVVRLKPAPIIKGIITDHDGKPLEGIVIRASGASRTPMTWARSNEKGEFQFRPLPAGEYYLTPVRSFFHHETGHLSSSHLPIPFKGVKYQLSSDSEPVKIVAPETVSIRVKVTDLDGDPLLGQHVSLRDVADYSNAPIATEVEGQPGLYEFQHPKGESIRDLKLRHAWDETVYYQEEPGLDFIPGSYVVLGKADEDIKGITIKVGSSATLVLNLVDAEGNPITDDFANVGAQINYPKNLSPSDRPVRLPTAPTRGKANDPSWIEMPGLVPDCDLSLSVYGRKIDKINKRIRLSPGEERELTLVIKPRSTATLSGTIRTIDGKQPEQKGWMYSRGEYAPVSPDQTSSRTYSSTEGDFSDTFRVEIPAGTTTIAHFTEGYAPAWIGPLKVQAMQNQTDLELVLEKGFSFPIQVVDDAGTPIPNASITALPVINDSTNGPVLPRTADENGILIHKHTADTQYEFRVKADSFQDYQSERMDVAKDRPIKLVMTPSPLTKGVVYDWLGRPAPDAKIYLSIKHTKGRSELGFDEQTLLATTDEQGKFSIKSLSEGYHYLTVIKLLDEARTLSTDVVAGATDLKINVPDRRDLKLTIHGDLNLLTHRKGKPTINVRQNVKLQAGDHSTGNLLGRAIVVTPLQNGEGGIAVYKGLVPGQVRVYGGGISKTVDVAEQGDTELTIDLQP